MLNILGTTMFSPCWAVGPREYAYRLGHGGIPQCAYHPGEGVLDSVFTFFIRDLVSWCVEPSQPQRITSALNTNLHSFSKLFISQVIIPQVMIF